MQYVYVWMDGWMDQVWRACGNRRSCWLPLSEQVRTVCAQCVRCYLSPTSTPNRTTFSSVPSLPRHTHTRTHARTPHAHTHTHTLCIPSFLPCIRPFSPQFTHT